MKNEIVVYQAEETSIRLEVRIEDETVWLSEAQMVELFRSTKQNINLHINNIFKEEELSFESTVKEYLIVQKEGSRNVKRKIRTYNLDVIISVGYRVKSKRGTQFRIWANKILKEYLLKGYAINNRVERLENEVHHIKNKLSVIDFQITTNLPPNEGIFYEGQVFDAYVLVCNIVKTARKSILLIDNYIDESVLLLLSKRNEDVMATVFTKTISKQLELDINKHNRQYPPIDVKQFSKSHDRFLIVDNETVYHIGASLKDLGKNWVAFAKIELKSLGILNKLGL